MQSSASVFEVPNGTSVFGTNFTASLKLVEKTKVSHDSYILKFELPEGKTFGVPLGGHCKFFAEINGSQVGRSYTPISDVSQTKTADFVIKVYRPTAEFPKGGKMTLHLENMKIG
jgi:ferredoxin-NADP reductase